MASKSNQLVLAPFNPGAIAIFRSQKNIQTSRKQPIWKTVKIDTRTSYSQLELDEVRMELADFLGGHM
uniref:Uncharacterized protein n=1 Tax=Cucumis melo TaxID=3656 RepID=A0A9I9EEM9_CUCME